MSWLGMRESVGRRLTVTLMASSAASLLIVFAAFIFYDLSVTRQSMVQNATTLADVVGRNSEVAIAYFDPATAEENMHALRASEMVLGAVVFDRYAQPFATWLPEGGSKQDLPASREAGVDFGRNFFDVHQPVVANGDVVGTIAIRSSTRELSKRVELYLAALLALLLLATLMATATSAWLQRRILAPVADLARSSKAVAGGALTVRVDFDSHDEIGVLARSFNAMTDGLQGVVAQVWDGIRDVSEVAGALRHSGSDLAEESERQRSVIADAGDSVDQVNESIRDVNQNLERLADSSRETSSSIVEMDASIRAVAEHMDHLEGSIDTTSAAVSQVAGSTDQVVAGVETLEAATQETAVRLRELTRTVKLVEENAEASRDLSDETEREAANGISAVAETIQAMREISRSFEQLDETVTRLDGRSNAIGEILQVIRGVAEQTSMLSLNAAIIAAQSGEQGRAFSVVADEINTLATRTQNSTRDISKLIAAVQEDTSAAVEAAEIGSLVVRTGVQRSNDAGTVLERISERSRASAERVHEISGATSRQNDDLERVNQAMQRVRDMVEQITETTRDQRNATGDIVGSVDNIRSVAKGVKLSTIEQRKGSQLITQAVTDVTGMIQEIVEATQQQTHSGVSIQRALDALKGSSQESAARSQAVNEMVETLSERAARLEKEIGRFDAGAADSESADS
jgi:methyl-accepting chemotaxis protein